MIDFLIRYTKIPKRGEVLHFNYNLEFLYFVGLEYDCFLCNVERSNICRFYFLEQPHAILIFLVAFFRFRQCKLGYSLSKEFDIRHQLILLCFFSILRFEAGFL